MAKSPLPILALAAGAFFLFRKDASGAGIKDIDAPDKSGNLPSWPPEGHTVLRSGPGYWEHCLDVVGENAIDNATVNLLLVGQDYAVKFKPLTKEPVKLTYEPTGKSDPGPFFGNFNWEKVGDEVRITFRCLRGGYAQIDLVEGEQKPGGDFKIHCMRMRTVGPNKEDETDPY